MLLELPSSSDVDTRTVTNTVPGPKVSSSPPLGQRMANGPGKLIVKGELLNDMEPEQLIATAREWMETGDFPEVLSADDKRLELPLYGPDGNWRMSVMADATPLVIVSQQHFPIHLPPGRRAQGALLCDAISRKLSIGDFRVDHEDGSVLMQVAIPIFGEPTTPELTTLFGELICRPIFAFHKALFPLTQFATGVLDREDCLMAIVSNDDANRNLWKDRSMQPERN